ncbi:MAG TPA: glycosyltransferase family 2 protein [Acidobacteriaceae bacterium]|nr:glycosyltransferase family 2 protein [Acidobacteriaceae bacterium]
MQSLARAQRGFTQTGRLDRIALRLAQRSLPGQMQTVRVALLASSTMQIEFSDGDCAMSGEEMPFVVCVVVNWNGWQDTVACLDSLRRQDYANLSVVVIDNGSANDSVERIRAAHPEVTLHQTGRNLGFPSGCNAGTRIAYRQGADLIWLLNNDTVAPPTTASNLVRTALAHPEAGAIGSVLYYMHDPEQIQAWGGGSVNLFTAFTSHFTAPASFAAGNTYFTGASLLIPRHICEQVGIFFEGFFMYCDDSDFCLRLHRAGYPLVMCEDTAILHKEGGSSPKRSSLIDQFATTANMRLLRRHASVPALSIAVYLSLRLLNRLLRGRWGNVSGVCRGVRIYLEEHKLSFTDRL